MVESIHLENKYLAEIFKNIQDGIIIMNEQRQILLMNPSARQLTSWQVGGYVPYCSFCETREVPVGENPCYLIENGEEQYFLSQMRTFNGMNIDVEMSVSLLSPPEESSQQEYLLVLRDQTLQIKAEEARFSKLMIKKLIEAKESEHKRLAQELHDGVGQSLFSISVALQTIESYVNNPKLDMYIVEVRKELEKVMNDVKSYSHQLRPHSIDQLGIIPTVQLLTESIQKIHPQLEIIFDVNFQERCHPAVEINLYRVVQEALHNITKYSQARVVHINMRRQEETDSLTLEIRDNGIGFDRQKLTSVGLGLKHMEERIDQLGGTIDIDSQLNEGTTISIRIPQWKKESLYD